MTDCRVCARPLFRDPLLRYTNMPRVAQCLPDQAMLADDRGQDLTIWQCSGCGLVQLRDAPVAYYKDVIRSSGLSDEMRSFRRVQFADFLGRHMLAGKRLLEVGCGRGEYLALLGEAGADASGLEHAESSVAACRLAGLQVRQGFIDHAEADLDGAPFDGFAMFNVLEHLPDPNATLRGIHRNLQDGAIGLVEVPNFDSMLRERQFAEFMSDHLCYFTAATLTAALSMNGFDVVSCAEAWRGYVLSMVVRKRHQLDLSAFDAHQAQRCADVRAHLQRFSPKGVAIWGAGHQALALIALFGLQDSIRYVVDAAPFKQGKYTPATHIPIVAPSTLATDPAEAVIVMAAGYSDEVARTIRAQFDRRLDVVIWRESGLEAA